jgi:hypothetical protein
MKNHPDVVAAGRGLVVVGPHALLKGVERALESPEGLVVLAELPQEDGIRVNGRERERVRVPERLRPDELRGLEQRQHLRAKNVGEPCLR